MSYQLRYVLSPECVSCDFRHMIKKHKSKIATGCVLSHLEWQMVFVSLLVTRFNHGQSLYSLVLFFLAKTAAILPQEEEKKTRCVPQSKNRKLSIFFLLLYVKTNSDFRRCQTLRKLEFFSWNTFVAMTEFLISPAARARLQEEAVLTAVTSQY